MTNITRRQNIGLGKTAAGGSGGSFAAHDRAAAAPPVSTRVFEMTDQLQRQANWAEDAQRNIDAMQETLAQQSSDLYDFQLAVEVKGKYPDAAKMLLEEHPDGHPTWSFAGLEDAHGGPVIVSDEDDLKFSDSAFGASYPGLGDADNFAQHTVDLDAALASPPNVHRRFLDSDADLDERAFSRLWSTAGSRGDLVGKVRTVEDVTSDVRVDLAPQHLTYLTQEDIDGAVRELMQGHEEANWSERESEEYQGRREDTANLLISLAELRAAEAEEAEAL